MASASLILTPASMACAFDPPGSTRITLAPAARARSPVSSLDPSSTTITSRTYRQPWQASTTSATVMPSLRAGTIASIVTGIGFSGSRVGGATGQSCPLAPSHELDRHLAAGFVDHLVAEHHRAHAVALGRLLVGLE